MFKMLHLLPLRVVHARVHHLVLPGEPDVALRRATALRRVVLGAVPVKLRHGLVHGLLVVYFILHISHLSRSPSKGGRSYERISVGFLECCHGLVGFIFAAIADLDAARLLGHLTVFVVFWGLFRSRNERLYVFVDTGATALTRIHFLWELGHRRFALL